MRKCSECKKVMIDGYVIEGGMAYYCSESCLHKNMTHEEFLVLYDVCFASEKYTTLQ